MNLIRTNSLLPAAVLWDMDGTIVDSEPYWMRAETELVESFGGVWTHADGMLLVGSGLFSSAAVLQERGVDLAPAAIVDWLSNRVQALLQEFGAPWRPGALELITELKGAGVPMALVTMSVERMAQQIAGLVGFAAFDTIIAGDMVTHSKPHPEAYLSAAGLLGVDPEHCIAVEDSVPGIASAVASGAVVIGVPHMVSLPESEHYDLWPTLAGRTLDGFTTLYSTRRGSTDRAQTLPDSTPANNEDVSNA